MAAFDDETVEFTIQKSFAEQFFAAHETRLELRPAAATHVGKVRKRNEDHHMVIRSTRSREVLFSNLPKDSVAFSEDESYGLIVADGIGGAASGDFASQLAVQTMFELAGRATSWVMRITDLNAQEIYQRVEAYIGEIQKTLVAYGETNPKFAGMGTTWTSAHILGHHAIVVHIGDSRAYLYRESELQLITRDQTLGQEMKDIGLPEEDVSRFRNILSNSLGGQSESVPAEVFHLEIEPGDRILLCTDGLSDMVSAPKIAEVLGSPIEPESACAQLVERALDAGGNDNITVVLCDVAAACETPRT